MIREFPKKIVGLNSTIWFVSYTCGRGAIMVQQENILGKAGMFFLCASYNEHKLHAQTVKITATRAVRQTIIIVCTQSLETRPRPHEESNLDLAFRKRSFYPLNYRGGENLTMRKHGAD